MSVKYNIAFRLSLLALLALLPLSCAKSETAVVFDGGKISLQEVNEKARMDLFQLEQQAYQVRQQAAYELVRDKVFELEAKAQGKTVEQLLADHVNSKQPIDDNLLRQIYEANKAQLPGSYEQVKGMLKTEMERQAKNSARNELTGNLFKKYNVKLELKEPVAPKLDIDIAGDPYWGPKDAKVVFVEFSDFECPYCKRMQPAIQQIKAEYADRVKWVFKDFPLDFHAQAMPAHIAAQCAGKQDKYFEFQQRVFNQPYEQNRKLDIGPAKLLQWAKEIGLNIAEFEKCRADADGAIRAEIEADIQYGQRIGVRGTPTLYANGRPANSARSYEDLKELIEKLLAE